MILLDSNIVIYASYVGGQPIRDSLAGRPFAVSAISLVEVLGFHRLTDTEREFLEEFFRITSVIPLSNEVLYRAISLRQSRKMSLGDSLIAATALIHRVPLMTRNTKDFAAIPALELLLPGAD